MRAFFLYHAHNNKWFQWPNLPDAHTEAFHCWSEMGIWGGSDPRRKRTTLLKCEEDERGRRDRCRRWRRRAGKARPASSVKKTSGEGAAGVVGEEDERGRHGRHRRRSARWLLLEANGDEANGEARVQACSSAGAAGLLLCGDGGAMAASVVSDGDSGERRWLWRWAIDLI
jgi:hypothetical protein